MHQYLPLFARWLQSPRAFIAAAALVVMLATVVAIVFGYLSPDSWYYILIAQGLRSGHGCALYGKYLAVYPCGYPALLALTSPGSGLATLMVSSKVTNLLLLAGSAFMVWKASRNILVATVVILNPITLLIFLYTWSENLELFCVCGVLYGLARLNENDRRGYAWLGLFLLLGVFCRYAFGPLAFVLFLCAGLAFGWRLALKTLPVFVVAGVVYLAYAGFNWAATHYATGMPRVPAPETLYYITRMFVTAFAANALMALVALAMLLGLSYRTLSYARDKSGQAGYAAFLLYAGIGFTVLSFALRARTLFDPFDTRTIGFGIVLILAGLTGRFVRLRDETKWPSWAVLISGLFSLIWCDGTSIPDGIDALRQGQYRFAAAHLDALRFHGPKAAAIVTFDMPGPPPDLWNVQPVKEIYYGQGPVLIWPALGPDLTPDTPQTFLYKLKMVNAPCVFDFIPFASADDFKAYLNTSTPVDESFSLYGTAAVKTRSNWNPAMQKYLLAIFQPARLVPCADVFARPETKAALRVPFDIDAADKTRHFSSTQ